MDSKKKFMSTKNRIQYVAYLYLVLKFDLLKQISARAQWLTVTDGWNGENVSYNIKFKS